MPEHMHSIWTLPVGDADFPTRWRRIKGRAAESARVDHGMAIVFGARVPPYEN